MILQTRTTIRRVVPRITLSDPGSIPPTAIVDSREQTPLEIVGLKTVIRGLVSGDYSFIGGEHLFAVERKSLADLVACATRERERFERELIRLRGYRFKRLLIIGTEEDLEAGNYVSSVPPQSVIGSLAAWEVRYDIPVVFVQNPDLGGAIISNWIRSFVREIVQDAARSIAQTPDSKEPKQLKIRQEAA